jgi:hypothetical protein
MEEAALGHTVGTAAAKSNGSSSGKLRLQQAAAPRACSGKQRQGKQHQGTQQQNKQQMTCKLRGKAKALFGQAVAG